MKKYLLFLSVAFMAMTASPFSALAAVLYVGATYEMGTTARTDRQEYETATDSFTNSFGVGYKIDSGIGYMFGISGNNFAIEYRENDTMITPGEEATPTRYAHTNIMLIGRSSIGSRRAKVGIGSGDAVVPALGNSIVATTKIYRTSTYLLGYDFVPGGGNLEDSRNGFFIEYQGVVARSGTFREVEDDDDISARETIRYNQLVFGYVYRFATSR